MTGFYIVLGFLALIGFLPLAIVLYRKKQVKKILSSGIMTKATVYNVRPISRSAAELVSYQFTVPTEGQAYAGSLSIAAGTYKPGDSLDVYYLPANPKRNTVNAAWGSPVIVAFGIAVALFVLFAVYKIYEGFRLGEM